MKTLQCLRTEIQYFKVIYLGQNLHNCIKAADVLDKLNMIREKNMYIVYT